MQYSASPWHQGESPYRQPSETCKIYTNMELLRGWDFHKEDSLTFHMAPNENSFSSCLLRSLEVIVR